MAAAVTKLTVRLRLQSVIASRVLWEQDPRLRVEVGVILTGPLVRAQDNGRGAGWQWAILDSPALEKKSALQVNEMSGREGEHSHLSRTHVWLMSAVNESCVFSFLKVCSHSRIYIRSLGSVLSFVQNRVYGICIFHGFTTSVYFINDNLEM